MGKLGDLRKELEEDLASLLPYRILDLLSRDLNDQESHKKGLSMLENLITKRGGLEGNNKSEYGNYLNQQEFEAFFQQIRPYLTVQEQIDLFLELQKRGSLEAGFLAFLSLTAIGFSRRKPEKLFEARKILKKLNISGLDSMPLIGCLDLLLADIDQATARFCSSSDEDLRNWLNNYSGDKLEAICVFCKNWLENDVLVGYRDIELKEIDLDTWFEDREIQEFIEKLENKTNKSLIKSRFQLQQKDFKEPNLESIKNSENNPSNSDDRTLPWPGGVKEKEDKVDIMNNSFKEEVFKNKSLEFYKYFLEKIAEVRFTLGEFLENKTLFNRSPYFVYLYAFLILFAFGIGIGFLKNNFKRPSQILKINNQPSLNSNKNVKGINKVSLGNKKSSTEKSNTFGSKRSENLPFEVREITSADPSLDEIEYLINSWLTNKSIFLAGKSEINLSKIAQNGLIKRTIEQRESDMKKGIFRNIVSKIQKIEPLSQTASRIVVLAELNYLEKIRNNTGELISETSLNPLKVKYIFGFSEKSWKLADFVSGL